MVTMWGCSPTTPATHSPTRCLPVSTKRPNKTPSRDRDRICEVHFGCGAGRVAHFLARYRGLPLLLPRVGTPHSPFFSMAGVTPTAAGHLHRPLLDCCRMFWDDVASHCIGCLELCCAGQVRGMEARHIPTCTRHDPAAVAVCHGRHALGLDDGLHIYVLNRSIVQSTIT